MTTPRWAVAFTAACCVALVAEAPAPAAAASESARLAHATTRCTRFAELLSCYEALSLKPNNPELLVAEADALVQVKRPGEAIGVYRNALTLGARAESVNTRIGQAQSLRRSLLDTCFRQEGAFAERACESAWLPGAPDEVAVFKRRGSLLEAEGRAGPALDAYLAAARLAPKDRAVAHAVVNLRESSGRRDAATLTAEGNAYLVLGRPKDAIGPLREAVRLAPRLPPGPGPTPYRRACRRPVAAGGPGQQGR